MLCVTPMLILPEDRRLARRPQFTAYCQRWQSLSGENDEAELRCEHDRLPRAMNNILASERVVVVAKVFTVPSI